MEATTSTAQQLIVRKVDGFKKVEEAALHNFTPGAQTRLQATIGPLACLAASSYMWSDDGAYLAVVSAGTVAFYDGNTQDKVAVLDVPNVVAVAFSPSAAYVATYQKPQQGANAEKNLKVWRMKEGAVVLQLFQKTFSRDQWPMIAYTADERFALHQVTNAVNVYDIQDPSVGVVRKLSLKGVGGFAVSPSVETPLLAAYVPEAKGAPGYAGIWRLDQLSKGDSPPPLCRRSFFRANTVKLLWNSKGSAVLALAASDVDKTGQSYYGEQKLYFLAASGTNDAIVSLKEGPVHDVQWARSGEHFAVVAGFMPAQTSVYSDRLNLLADLGTGPHNIVRWNPQGRFLAVAGFGNLPGDIAFHGRSADGKYTPIGAARAEVGVSCDWSPDGQHFLTATTAPRLRVDNGLQIYRYNGEQLLEEKYDVLLEARWRPAPGGSFPELPEVAHISSAAGVRAINPAAPSRPAAFRAPQLRGSAGTPGADPEEPKAVSKNAKRRQRSKAKATEEHGVGQHQQQAATTIAPAAEQSAAAQGEGYAEAGEAQDAGKRLRNLQKKLRQIQQLKDKQAAGATLEPEQLQKIASEAALLEEMAGLSVE